ncbi:MAG: hypothetical protein AAGC57_02270 [Pseudomonadota bacterium]
MPTGTIERHQPRQVSDLGFWAVEPLKLKIYGLAQPAAPLTEPAVIEARDAVDRMVPAAVEAEGD